MIKTNTNNLTSNLSNLGNLKGTNADRGGFIKETVNPGGQIGVGQGSPDAAQGIRLDPAQKALLNRKGNMLFNEGNIEGARRVFITTGYSDGLSRIGDYYRSHGRAIDALQMYRIAPNKKKADELTMNLALLIKSMLTENGSSSKGVVYGTR